MKQAIDFVDDFIKIDTARAWLVPFLPIHQAFAATLGEYAGRFSGKLSVWLNDYFEQNQLSLHNFQGKPLTFTDQSDLPHGEAYEKYIADTGKIPTRDNLHDWFGACIWAVFGKSKAVLNAHHLRHLSDGQRNRVRDAITVFDENGAVVVTTSENLAAALTSFDWQNALVAPRPLWYDAKQPSQAAAQAFIFGHALLEQLITPRKNLCAHTIVLIVPNDFFELSEAEKLAAVDEKLAAYLDAWLAGELENKPLESISPRQLQPLPILGVPHFWANQDAAFYADTQVFRAGRRQTKG